jgi:hypothetical protein
MIVLIFPEIRSQLKRVPLDVQQLAVPGIAEKYRLVLLLVISLFGHVRRGVGNVV